MGGLLPPLLVQVVAVVVEVAVLEYVEVIKHLWYLVAVAQEYMG